MEKKKRKEKKKESRVGCFIYKATNTIWEIGNYRHTVSQNKEPKRVEDDI